MMDRLIVWTLIFSVLFSLLQPAASSTAQELETFEPSIRNDYLVDADVFGRYFSALFLNGALSAVLSKKAQSVKTYFDGVNSLTVSTSSMVLNHGEVVITLDNQSGLASITTQPSKQHVAVVNVGVSGGGTVHDVKVPHMSPPIRSYMCVITTPSFAEFNHLRKNILRIVKREINLKRLYKGALIGCAQIAMTPARKRNLAMDLLSKKMPQSMTSFKPPKTVADSKKQYDIPKSMIIDYFLDDGTEDPLSEATLSDNLNEYSSSGPPLESPDNAMVDDINSSPTFGSSSPDVFTPSSVEVPVDLKLSNDWLQRLTVFRGAPPPGGLIKRYSIQIRADVLVEQTSKALSLSKDGEFITLVMSNDGFDINAGIDDGQTFISRLLDFDELFTEVKFARNAYGLNAMISSRAIPGQEEFEQESFSIDEKVCFAIDVATRAVAQRAISCEDLLMSVDDDYYKDEIVICISF